MLGRARGGCAACLYSGGARFDQSLPPLRNVNTERTLAHPGLELAASVRPLDLLGPSSLRAKASPGICMTTFSTGDHGGTPRGTPHIRARKEGKCGGSHTIAGVGCRQESRFSPSNRCSPSWLPALSLFGILPNSQNPKMSRMIVFSDWPVQPQVIHFVTFQQAAIMRGASHN